MSESEKHDKRGEQKRPSFLVSYSPCVFFLFANIDTPRSGKKKQRRQRSIGRQIKQLI
jgi:hypothetical protein